MALTRRSVPATHKAFTRARLAELADDDRCTQNVVVLDGAVHSQFSCATTRRRDSAPTQSMTWSQLRTRRVCPDCTHGLGTHGGSAALRDVRALQFGVDVCNSVDRFLLTEGAAAAGKVTVLERKLTEATSAATGVRNDHARSWPELSEMADHILTQLADTSAHLSNATRGEGPVRTAILARVADELVPTRLKSVVTLEDDRVLAVLHGPAGTGKKVLEVIDVCAVARSHRAVLLDCPRYVVDYINRFFTAGQSWDGVIVATPAADLTAAELKATTALWANAGTGPLADVRTAIATARTLN